VLSTDEPTTEPAEPKRNPRKRWWGQLLKSVFSRPAIIAILTVALAIITGDGLAKAFPTTWPFNVLSQYPLVVQALAGLIPVVITVLREWKSKPDSEPSKEHKRRVVLIAPVIFLMTVGVSTGLGVVITPVLPGPPTAGATASQPGGASTQAPPQPTTSMVAPITTSRAKTTVAPPIASMPSSAPPLTTTAAQADASLPDLSGGMSLVLTNMDGNAASQQSWAVNLVRWPANKCLTADPCYFGSTWYTTPKGTHQQGQFVLTVRRVGSTVVVSATDDGFPPDAKQRYDGTETGDLTFSGTFRDNSNGNTADMTLASCRAQPTPPACGLLPPS
jgi:hypothetical protein